MKAHCPKCGSAAKFVSQKARTIDFSEVVFQCQSPKCGGEVLAEVRFAMRKTPADQCFSHGGKSVAASISTDC